MINVIRSIRKMAPKLPEKPQAPVPPVYLLPPKPTRQIHYGMNNSVFQDSKNLYNGEQFTAQQALEFGQEKGLKPEQVVISARHHYNGDCWPTILIEESISDQDWQAQYDQKYELEQKAYDLAHSKYVKKSAHYHDKAAHVGLLLKTMLERSAELAARTLCEELISRKAHLPIVSTHFDHNRYDWVLQVQMNSDEHKKVPTSWLTFPVEIVVN